MLLADIGPPRRFAAGNLRIDARIQISAVAQHLREQAQLAGGAASLAFQPPARQAGFLHRPFDQFIAQAFDLRGDGFQKIRAPRRRRQPVGTKRLLRQGAGLFQIGSGGGSKTGASLSPVAGL